MHCQTNFYVCIVCADQHLVRDHIVVLAKWTLNPCFQYNMRHVLTAEISFSSFCSYLYLPPLTFTKDGKSFQNSRLGICSAPRAPRPNRRTKTPPTRYTTTRTKNLQAITICYRAMVAMCTRSICITKSRGMKQRGRRHLVYMYHTKKP